MNNLREGERRHVTVLFSDMKGFTALSESMDPEEMDTLMGQVFGAFESVVLRFDGVVEKYIGDALVAVFGAPTIHEDDPTRAINAALDFQSELRHLNRMLRRNDVELTFRTGINTGLVTTGKRGKFEVVTGHTMSVASRLEAAAPSAGILVSESTKEKCESDFLFSDPVQVPTRGGEGTTVAFRVLGRNADPQSKEQVFVGRADILARLTKGYLRHNPASTDGFYILGPAGIGKTALVTTFIDRLRTYPEYDSAVLYATARPYRRTSFSVVRDLILNYLNIETPRNATALHSELVGNLGIDETTAKEFAALLSSNQSSRVDNQAFVHLYAVLKHILKKHEHNPYPVLIVIDDASFVERQSRDFFRFFLKNADVHPFFVLTDRRPETSISELFAGCEQIELEPLTDEESRECLAQLQPDLENESVQESIVRQSQGNPLFIREYTRSAGSNVPTTIQNILLTSIADLQPDYRDFLKKLSVFFVSFSQADAAYMQERTDGDSAIVSDALSYFLREAILVEKQGVYWFRQDLLRHALYNSILNYNKRILHRLIAERMQESEQPHTLRLLDHLLSAEEYDQAREFLLHVPDLALSPDYITYLDVFLEKIEAVDTNARIVCLFMKSAILFNNGLTKQSDEILKEIIGLALHSKEPSYLARAYHILCAFNMKSYSFAKATYCGLQAVAYYAKSTESQNRYQNMQNVLGIVSLAEALGSNEKAARRYLKQAGELESVHELGLVNNWAELHLLYSRYQQTVDSLAPYGKPDDRDSIQGHWLSSCFLRIVALWHLCDFEGLIEAVDLLRTHEPRNQANLSQVYAYLAVACRKTGDSSRSGGYLQQAEFYSLQSHNDFDRVDTLRTLAEAYIVLGNREQAQKVAEEGLAIALQNSAYYPGFTLSLILAELAYTSSSTSEVGFYLREATASIESRTALRNRDRMLYHYLMAQTELDEYRDHHLQAAAALMESERENMGTAAQFDTLMTLRCFPELRRTLETLVAQS